MYSLFSYSCFTSCRLSRQRQTTTSADDTNPGVEDVVTPDENGDTTADDTTADDTNAADDASTADDTNADNADAAADAENADAPVEENTEADGADATVAE